VIAMHASPLLYRSTRGQAPELDFLGAVTTGLARDGGLYVPTLWPYFSPATLRSWRDQPYAVIAEQVLGALVGNAMPLPALRGGIQRGLANFTHADITPLQRLDERTWLLELFHGPTLAFKDIALQLLGQLFDYTLGQSGQRATVVGATSGDTGSAAIAGCAASANLDVFILYPHNGPSEIQRRQMTTISAPHVHVIAVDGSFDDCQAIVKAMFNDAALRDAFNLTAVNSINWARIAAQIVYYFVAAVRLGAPDVAPSFVVPTGNFGNIFAGFAAMQMGLPIAKLAAATNANNAVHRFFTTGTIAPAPMQPTHSPSMDIQVPSNLERLLFTLMGNDGAAVQTMLAAPDLRITPFALGHARQYFTSASVDDATTLTTIQRVHAASGIVLDPHTAVGVAAAQSLAHELPDPIICLGCAHPAKFPATVARALGRPVALPPAIAALGTLPERITRLPADLARITAFIAAQRGR
jgi:threonine synthase